MPILGIIASSITGNLVTNSYESISTVTVGAGGASSVSFTSIPSTFKHLQVRFSGLSNTAASLFLRLNSDTNQANYVTHALTGQGSAASAVYIGASTGRTGVIVGGFSAQLGNTYPFVGITDLLDYTNTNKLRTLRHLNGVDKNGSGEVSLSSGWYNSTTAVSGLEFYLDGGANFAQYSSFALYGIKN